MLRARDIMRQPVITVTPTTPVTEVARTLNDNGISGCPVLDHAGRLRGVVSRTNILDFALTVEGGALTPILKSLVPGLDAVEEEVAYAPLNDDFEVPEAQDLMEPDVVTISPDTTLTEIARIMSTERIHRVPVMAGQKLVGIITSLDLLEVFQDAENVTGPSR